MRSQLSALVTVVACGFAAAQPCEPDFVYESELHRYQVLVGGLALTTFDDGRGAAVYAGLFAHDLRGANVLRLAGGQPEPEPVGAPIAFPFQIMALHVFDADGMGPEPPRLYAGGWSVNQVWRLVDDEWQALPGRLPPFGREIRDIADYDDGTGAAIYVHRRLRHALRPSVRATARAGALG